MKNITSAKKWEKEKNLKGKAGKIADKISTAYYLLDSIENDKLLSRRESTLCRKLVIDYQARQGEWNGYGYTILGQAFCDDPAKSSKKIKNYIKELKKELKKCKKIVAECSEEEMKAKRIEAWSNRLCRLTEIDKEKARKIAREKLEYKEKQIKMIEDRQAENFSIKRAKLIDKMRRENPLRRIQDEEHARAILAASDRHCKTDYETILEETRNDAEWGMIRREDVRSIARQAITDN